MTMHLESMWKGNRKNFLVPKCKQWAMSAMYGAMTTDKSLVDCKSCAKQGGFEPAAKVETGSPSGTCQCCFGTFKLPNGKGRISIHGYKRPGVGYLLGECRGQKHLPYEKSCEQTKVYLREVIGHIDSLSNYLQRLEAGEVNELPCTRDTYPDATIPWFKQKAVRKTFIVKRGDEHTRRDDLHCTLPDFEALLEGEIRDVISGLRRAADEREFLATKVAEWKLVP